MESEMLKVIVDSEGLNFIVHLFAKEASTSKINLSKITRLCSVRLAESNPLIQRSLAVPLVAISV